MIVSEHPLPSTGVFRLSIKVVEAGYSGMYIGIVSEKTHLRQFDFHKEAMTYYAGDGEVAYNGKYHKVDGKKLENDDVVDILVNWDAMAISWFANSKLLTTVPIRKEFVGERIFANVIMRWVDQ